MITLTPSQRVSTPAFGKKPASQPRFHGVTDFAPARKGLTLAAVIAAMFTAGCSLVREKQEPYLGPYVTDLAGSDHPQTSIRKYLRSLTDDAVDPEQSHFHESDQQTATVVLLDGTIMELTEDMLDIKPAEGDSVNSTNAKTLRVAREEFQRLGLQTP